MTSSDTARLVEMNEAHAYARLITEAPAETAERYGLATQRVGSAYALVAARLSDSLTLNRAIGLGVCEPVTLGMLEALDEMYRKHGVATYAAELGPSSEPAELPSLLSSRGFVPLKKMTMLYRSVEPIAVPPCDFQVKRVGPERAAVFADMACGIFQFEEPFPSLLRATFRHPAWRHWMAFAGEQLVALAIMHIENDVAWIGWVGTLADYRGRGAQSALTAAQLQDAHENHCRWVTLEIVPGTKKRPSRSLSNYRRLGWTVAYDRIVYARKAGRHAT